MTLVLPAAQQAEVSSLMRNLRQGIAAAPKANLVGDGLGLLIFATQFSTFTQSVKNLFDQVSSDQDVDAWAFANSLTSTVSAGFSAAQGVMDTALSSRLKALNNALQVPGAKSVSVAMGRLHMFLGGFTYLFGAFASASSLMNRHDTWQEAVRSGDRSAQSAAMASMVGAGGCWDPMHMGWLTPFMQDIRWRFGCLLGRRRGASGVGVLAFQPRRGAVYRARAWWELVL
nr:hypothetical protein [Halomonas elongata]